MTATHRFAAILLSMAVVLGACTAPSSAVGTNGAAAWQPGQVFPYPIVADPGFRGEFADPFWEATEAEIMAILTQLRNWQTGVQIEQPHGSNAYSNSVFYQWYWVTWNPPVVGVGEKDRLAPSIDNAWLAAALMTIRSYAQAHSLDSMAALADSILADMDFRLWFDEDTHLFDWGGIDSPQGGFPADYYSNENRIINFVARALGQLSRDEYQASLVLQRKVAGGRSRRQAWYCSPTH